MIIAKNIYIITSFFSMKKRHLMPEFFLSDKADLVFYIIFLLLKMKYFMKFFNKQIKLAKVSCTIGARDISTIIDSIILNFSPSVLYINGYGPNVLICLLKNCIIYLSLWNLKIIHLKYYICFIYLKNPGIKHPFVLENQNVIN